MQKLVIGGFYRHFKGRVYQVTETAIHSETLEVFVIYKDSEGHIWARPEKMFLDEVQLEGRRVPRFELEENQH